MRRIVSSEHAANAFLSLFSAPKAPGLGAEPTFVWTAPQAAARTVTRCQCGFEGMCRTKQADKTINYVIKVRRRAVGDPARRHTKTAAQHGKTNAQGEARW
ncbi:MAG: hypothetical protein ROR55_21885 [Devosia sp.]